MKQGAFVTYLITCDVLWRAQGEFQIHLKPDHMDGGQI